MMEIGLPLEVPWKLVHPLELVPYHVQNSLVGVPHDDDDDGPHVVALFPVDQLL